jgi:hypothetical protein
MKPIQIACFILAVMTISCSTSVEPPDFTAPDKLSYPDLPVPETGLFFSMGTVGERWLYIDAEKDFEYHVKVDRISGDFEYSSLCGQDKNLASTEYSDTLNGKFTFKSKAAQRLYVHILMQKIKDIGSFSVSYSKVPLEDGMPVIAPGVMYYGATDSAGMNLRLSTEAGKNYFLSWEKYPSNYNYLVYLSCFDSSGTYFFKRLEHTSLYTYEYIKVTGNLPLTLTAVSGYGGGRYRIYLREEAAGCPTMPIKLTQGQWYDSNTEGEDSCYDIWFCFDTVATKTYRIYWDSVEALNGKTANVNVYAYNKTLSGLSSVSISTTSGYATGAEFTATGTQALIKVNGKKGSFAVKYE